MLYYHEPGALDLVEDQSKMKFGGVIGGILKNRIKEDQYW